MNLKKIFVILLSLGFVSPMVPADFEGHGLDEEQVEAYESYRKRCKEFKSIKVCGNATIGGSETVGGNLTVTGTVTAGNFALSPAASAGTPGLPGIGGALAWGELSNTAGAVAVAAGVVPMNNATSGTSLSGMTAATGAGASLTLTNAGLYLFMYEVGYAAGAAATTTVAINLNANTVAIPNSTFTTSFVNPAATSQVAQINGFAISFQSAGAVIQLNTSTGFTTPAASNVGAKLTAIRLS